MASTSFPRTRRCSKGRRPQRSANFISNFLLVLGGGISVGIIGFWAISSTLTDMTWRDCQAGIQRACEEVQR
jgi:hypothetical protein